MCNPAIFDYHFAELRKVQQLYLGRGPVIMITHPPFIHNLLKSYLCVTLTEKHSLSQELTVPTIPNFETKMLRFLLLLLLLLTYHLEEVNDCSSNPCKNNGTCTDLVKRYNCSCAPGFTGPHCETGLLSYSDVPDLACARTWLTLIYFSGTMLCKKGNCL